MNKRELELYIHIPFCARKCSYCDFLSYAAPERLYRSYIDQLIDEIRGQSAGFEACRIVSVFIGGGTPSILPSGMLEELFGVLHENFDLADDAEFTLEANPGTLTMEKLEVCRQGGVNRLSLGLQSADDQELAYLGRIHTYDTFLKSYQRAREAGFTNINVDLMSALPGQTVQSWKSTLKKVMMLRPEHISAYSLMIEEGTPFWQRYGESGSGNCIVENDVWWDRGIGRRPVSLFDLPDLPDEETDRQMYHLTKELMEAQGYERYEISNYAKAGFACRHNIGYWTGVDYLGLGLGASSYTFGYRYQNTDNLEEYLSLDLMQAGAAVRDIQELTQKDKVEEFMFLGLRMTEGVSGSEFMKRFGQNMWNVYEAVLPGLEQQGLIISEPPNLRLSPLGIDVSNMVLSQFLL